MTIAERIFALKSIPPFDRLRDAELALIAEAARVRHYGPGETVCGPEQPVYRLHVVVEGGVVDAAGRSAPPVVGLAALLLDEPATPVLRASSAGATCLLINKGNFFTTVNECPGLVAGFLELPAGV